MPTSQRIGMLFLSLFLVSCSTPKEVAFSRVRYLHLKDEAGLLDKKTDPMIPFERKFILHGAVSKEEREDRYGNYYAFCWDGIPGETPIDLLFEFRQAGTGDKIHQRRQSISRIKRRNWTNVAIIGSAYQTNGKVVAWKASLLRGNQVLDTEESFLWK